MKIISTGGSQNPDQLIENVGKAADGTMHLTFSRPGLRKRLRIPRRRKPSSMNGEEGTTVRKPDSELPRL